MTNKKANETLEQPYAGRSVPSVTTDSTQPREAKPRYVDCWKCQKTVLVRKDGMLAEHLVRRMVTRHKDALRRCPASNTLPNTLEVCDLIRRATDRSIER